MAKQKQKIAICELPLITDAAKDRVLEVRFRAYDMVFNAALGEALRRLDLMRQSKQYQAAQKLPKPKPIANGKRRSPEDQVIADARNSAFKSCRERFGFEEHNLFAIWTTKPLTAESRLKGKITRITRKIERVDEPEKSQLKKELNELITIGTELVEANRPGKCANSWVADHLGKLVCQAATTHAFKAVEEYSFGKRGRPRFTSKYNPGHSVDSKVGATLMWDEEKRSVIWGSLILEPMIDMNDEVVSYSLKHKIQYVRLTRKPGPYGWRYYAQLVFRGETFDYNIKPGSNIVGLDLGPSTIAYVAHDGERVIAAKLERLAPEIFDKSKEIRRLQRKLDRQTRSNNPENYRKNGTVKKGRKIWVHSKGERKTQRKLALVHSKFAGQRKTSHGMMSNEILKMGVIVTTEKLNYKQWQKLWGKSIKDRAPGLLIDLINKKCSRYGGELNQCSTKETKLSRTCECGLIKQKTLAQRWHVCYDCGTGPIQRDIYSAFLASCTRVNKLDVGQARKLSKAGADKLLKTASSEAVSNGIAIGYGKHKSSLGISLLPHSNVSECSSHHKEGSNVIDGSKDLDAVTMASALREPDRAVDLSLDSCVSTRQCNCNCESFGYDEIPIPARIQEAAENCGETNNPTATKIICSGIYRSARILDGN